MTTSNIPQSSGIYVISNIKNGKVYIGKTAVGFRKRWLKHKHALNNNYHDNQHLQRAWNRYGEKSFKFLILEYCLVEQLDEREKHYISIYRPKNMTYNMTDGGDGGLGYKHTDESKLKMSKAHKGKKLTPEHIAKSAAANRGRKPSPETIAKISAANKGRIRSPEHRAAVGNAHRGKKLSDEQIAKMKLSLKGRVFSQEHRDRIGLAHKGRIHSPESIAKYAETRSEWWIVITPEGTEMKIKNLKAFCRDNGLDQRHMSKVANGKAKHHKQWRCHRA